MVVTTRLVHCPHCENTKVTKVDSVNPKSRLLWFHCQTCGRLFTEITIDAGTRPFAATARIVH